MDAAAQEVPMTQHPTIIHTVADLRWRAYLTEAAEATRGAPGPTSPIFRRWIRPVQRAGDRVAAIVGRVVEDFEPTPGRRTAQAGQRLR